MTFEPFSEFHSHLLVAIIAVVVAISIRQTIISCILAAASRITRGLLLQPIRIPAKSSAKFLGRIPRIPCRIPTIIWILVPYCPIWDLISVMSSRIPVISTLIPVISSLISLISLIFLIIFPVFQWSKIQISIWKLLRKTKTFFCSL